MNASRNEMAPHFPLTGPTKIALYVEKTDITMEGYKLDWRISDSQVMRRHAVSKILRYYSHDDSEGLIYLKFEMLF